MEHTFLVFYPTSNAPATRNHLLSVISLLDRTSVPKNKTKSVAFLKKTNNKHFAEKQLIF